MGIELEIGAITLKAVAEAVEAAGGILHNCSNLGTGGGHNTVYPYHTSARYGYNHGDSATTEKPVWKVERDGSIDNAHTGANTPDCFVDMTMTVKGVGELISPILYGKKGIFHIRKVAANLKAAGAVMNKGMGAHMTYGVNTNARFARFGRSKKEAITRRMKSVYTHYANVFDALSPNTRQMVRRDGCSSNYYCALPNDSKMSAIRVNSFVNYGIVEFRQPGHTLDIHNLTGWLKLTNSFISACMNDNKKTKDGRKAMKVNLATEPKTLESLLNLTNPGSLTEDWAVGRVTRLMNNYTQNRENRRRVLGGEQ
tara:strand:- start:1618 stop:2553 length:936 start_codon:yes stop_codon:yes gene_type:complete